VTNLEQELYSFALGNALNEISKICPDVKNAFIINENGKVIAKDEKTPEKAVSGVTDALGGMLEKADAIGNFDGATIEYKKGRVSMSCVNGLYLVTIASTKADLNYVKSVTGVVVPTVLRLIEKVSPASLTEGKPEPEAESVLEEPEKPKREPEKKPEIEEQTENEVEYEASVPGPQSNQFIVEDIKGLLVKGDTARIDNSILLQWKRVYHDRDIEEVEIETFNGKITRCKVKPIKDSKYEGKGKVQMPEKIQAELDIRKGELVRVKPLFE
jgi:predicted regulator of Ras-like GTPase activity (Roadblock/LC7/MglB family)